MRPIPSTIEDQLNGIVTYELNDGRRLRLNERDVRREGAYAILRRSGCGDILPTERRPVFQDGRRLGTMAPDFDPIWVRSRSALYEPRPGDFRCEGNAWIADSTLGRGDLEAVVGFIWEEPRDRGRHPEGDETPTAAQSSEAR